MSVNGIQNQGGAMSAEEVKALWNQMSGISDDIKEIKNDIKENFAKLPCNTNVVKIAKIEQQLENNAKSKEGSRHWIALVTGWFLTIVALGLTIILSLLKK